MPFTDFVGQEHIIKLLQKSLAEGRLNHALLFTGPVSSGKKTLALLLAQALNCTSKGDVPCGGCLSCRKIDNLNHPDLRIMVKEGANIKIEQVRSLKQEAVRHPFEGKKKIYIIDNVEDMSIPASNSFLKLLEEPPDYVTFILLSCRPQALLSTIKSRCQVLPFRQVSEEKIAALLMKKNEVLPGEARVFASLARGCVGQAVVFAGDEVYRNLRERVISLINKLHSVKEEDVLTLAEETAGEENLLLFLDTMLIFLRDILIYKRTNNPELIYNLDFNDDIDRLASRYFESDILKVINKILVTRKQLYASVNIKQAMGVLFLELKEVI